MMASYDFFFKAQRRGMPSGSMERSVSLKIVSSGGYDARALELEQLPKPVNEKSPAAQLAAKRCLCL
jgi:hypothetical protein